MPSPASYHMRLLHYCYYCNHPTRTQFLQQMNGGTCPYYWKPAVKNQCGGDPVFVSPYAFENYNRAVGLGQQSISNNVPAILDATLARKTKGQEDGSVESSSSNSYYCYCKSSNRYGIACDAYTSFWIPARYNGLPFVAMAFRVALFLVIMGLLFEPRMENEWRETMGDGKSCRGFWRFIRSFFDKLAYHVIFFMNLGLLFLCIENLGTIVDPESFLRK
jgi:hypothetical protein